MRGLSPYRILEERQKQQGSNTERSYVSESHNKLSFDCCSYGPCLSLLTSRCFENFCNAVYTEQYWMGAAGPTGVHKLPLHAQSVLYSVSLLHVKNAATSCSDSFDPTQLPPHGQPKCSGDLNLLVEQQALQRSHSATRAVIINQLTQHRRLRVKLRRRHKSGSGQVSRGDWDNKCEYIEADEHFTLGLTGTTCTRDCQALVQYVEC